MRRRTASALSDAIRQILGATVLFLTDDAARVHDAHLNDREWVRNIASPTPDGVVPNGPVGIANFVSGAIPFWLHNEVHPDADEKGEVTLTR